MAAAGDDYDRFIMDDENAGDDDGDDDEEDFDSPPILPFLLDDADPLLQTDTSDTSGSSQSSSAKLSRSQVESLTVSELKQQLRLRNLAVGGKKAELVDRLLGLEGRATMSIGGEQVGGASAKRGNGSAGVANGSAARGTPVDVSAYLDEEDRGKSFKSSDGSSSSGAASEQSQEEEDDDDSDASSTPSPYATEVWGEEARIVDDYEGRSIVVDSLSRTVIEYRGYNRTKTQAYVTAHRTALKAFIAGGSGNSTVATTATIATPSAKRRNKRWRRIQRQREEERQDHPQGLYRRRCARYTGDEAGYYTEILERDYGDWGVYSPTGAQISAQEVQGVLLLSDVRGCFPRRCAGAGR